MPIEIRIYYKTDTKPRNNRHNNTNIQIIFLSQITELTHAWLRLPLTRCEERMLGHIRTSV